MSASCERRPCASASSAWATGARTSPATSRAAGRRARLVLRPRPGEPGAASRRVPGARAFTEHLDDLLGDPELDAIVDRDAGARATPSSRIGRSRPASTASSRSRSRSTVEDARELVDRGRARDRRLMVGHLLRFHPGVAMVEELAGCRRARRGLYLYTNRVNFGKVRGDENALWSLGAARHRAGARPRGERPRQVSARGESLPARRRRGRRLRLPASSRPGVMAHHHVSWLDPHKRRMLTVVGTERMALRRHRRRPQGHDLRQGLLARALRDLGRVPNLHGSGDVRIPRVPATEPLQIECRLRRRHPRGRGSRRERREGLAVVEVLNALQRSMERGRRAASSSTPEPAAGPAARPREPGARRGRRARRRRRDRGQRRHPRRHARSATACGSATARCSASSPAWGAARRPSASRCRRCVVGDGRRHLANAVVYAGVESARGRSSATWRRSASAARSAPTTVVGRGVCVENDNDRRARRIQSNSYITAVLPARGRRLHRALRVDHERQLHGPHRAAPRADQGRDDPPRRAGRRRRRACCRASRSARRRSSPPGPW